MTILFEGVNFRAFKPFCQGLKSIDEEKTGVFFIR